MNFPCNFCGICTCRIPRCSVSGFPQLATSSIPIHYTCRHLIPCFPSCSCLRLALVHFPPIFLCVLWPTAPSIPFSFPCSMHQHSSVHLSYPTPSIDPHTHPSAIHTYLYSLLLSRTRFSALCLFHHFWSFHTGKDDALQPVSTFAGSPDWVFHCSP